ncbi:hypothetical protein RFI_34238 [Reticulomyxa filosa]|uniref:Transmembrane protein n=1 Tax=Reticulomyxa filosa TaxID=46433 RepID=X6LPT7_RETFI|nr:hypothetical protein RFI_34238 [Reticulomyxa filosa]|eukprot:ETO03172.1 hypothetical protein RFI_34238 [Reticulomyxa filosa]
MSLNAQKAGFTSKTWLIISLIVSLSCAVYCAWLLHVVRRHLWNPIRERTGSESPREVQLSTQKSDTRETSISVSAPEKGGKPVAIDAKIKWIVTLYIFGTFMISVAHAGERMLYALNGVADKACNRALYVVYLRAFTEGLFFSFYVVRATVGLQGSVFAVSKCQQYFFGITPPVTYAIALFAHNLRADIDNCKGPLSIEFAMAAMVYFIDLFWQISLFAFLVYHIRKVIYLFNI